jgi:1-phosphatidylinositol-3-phosphate 5-kinase
MLLKSRADKRLIREARITNGGEAFMPDDVSVAESTSTWGMINLDASDTANPTDDLKVPSSKLPWAICGYLVRFDCAIPLTLHSVRKWWSSY